LTGKLAIDDNAASVSQMLAEFLAVPHATVVTKLETADTQATVERETEGGSREVIQLRLPAVVAANKGLNMPRYASLPGIMKAKKKTIKELALDGVGASMGDVRTKYVAFALPPEKPAVKMIAGEPSAQASQLAQLLRQEAKVI
ncbi:MAG: electron transfer flavoprotein beta subunit/FixA family protein, partial [Bdellovibrionota bacterium]